MMRDLWSSLPATLQDAALLGAILAPPLLLGWLICRGLAMRVLLCALLRRYFWTNIAFVLLVALSVGLGVGLIAQERGLRQASARVADRFDLVIAAPGDEISMLMATVYVQPNDAPLLGGDIWAEVAAAAGEANAAPIAFGDSWQGYPIIGSTPGFVAHLAGQPAEGRSFAAPFEAVIGASVPLDFGAEIQPAHGQGEAAEEGAHEAIRVVGRLAPTGSPWDRAIIIPVEGVWLSHGMGNGHSDVEDMRIGPPFDPRHFPGAPAILVTTPDLSAAYGLQAQFSTARSMAFFPGAVLSRLHGLMGDMREIMSVMSLGTQALVASGVIVGLIVLTRLFERRLALLGALGAPARAIFALIWSYAALLLGAGAILGLAVGLVAARAIAAVLSARSGLAIQTAPGWPELHLVAGCFAMALLIALLPAAAALARPLSRSLRR